MSVQTALVAYLKTVSAITALVGTSPARIRPFERLQGEALPAITYQDIDSVSNHTFNGTAGLTRWRFQLDFWASSDESAIALYGAAKAATDGFKGTFGSDIIRGCVFIGSNPSELERSADHNTKWYRRSMDWYIYHA